MSPSTDLLALAQALHHLEHALALADDLALPLVANSIDFARARIAERLDPGDRVRAIPLP